MPDEGKAQTTGPSDIGRLVLVGNDLRDAIKTQTEAIKAQTDAMGRHSRGLTFATYVLAVATIVLAGAAVVQVFC